MSITAQEIYATTPDNKGWRKLPSGIYVKLGDYVKLDDYVKLGDDVTSLQLAELYRQTYRDLAPEHIFCKWLTRNRMSLGWGASSPIKYEVGAIVEAEGEASDQKCAPGLHVFRVGERPEWHGLCEANHNLIAVRVRVKSEDILFAGLPTMDAKLRVRKLEVLD